MLALGKEGREGVATGRGGWRRHVGDKAGSGGLDAVGEFWAQM